MKTTETREGMRSLKEKKKVRGGEKKITTTKMNAKKKKFKIKRNMKKRQ